MNQLHLYIKPVWFNDLVWMILMPDLWMNQSLEMDLFNKSISEYEKCNDSIWSAFPKNNYVCKFCHYNRV